MMKTLIAAIGWMTIVMIVGQLAYGQDSQNLQNTDKYQCIKKTMLYQGNIAKLKLSPGDMVDAYPSPKGDGWLKVIIEGQTYAAPASDFILWRKSRIPTPEEAYLAMQAGTYEPPNMVIADAPRDKYGVVITTSTRGSRIPTPEEAAKGAVIPTTIHKDIYGRPTQQIAGGGIKRGMGGKVIPRTAEQLAGMTDIDVAKTDAERNWNRRVPIAQEKTTAELLKFADTKAKLEIAREYAKLTPEEKFARTQQERSFQYDSGTETGHWLQENIDSGHYLLLEDGTLYEVDAVDRIDCSLWLPISDLIVIDKGYDYLIINKDDEESVHAKKVAR